MQAPVTNMRQRAAYFDSGALPLVLLAALSVVLSLPGCVPFPHYTTEKPRITGLVKYRGAPVAGATVKRVSAGLWKTSDTCGQLRPDEKIEETLTGADGSFDLEDQELFRFTSPIIPGDRMFCERLCLVVNGTQIRTWRFCAFGGMSSPDYLHLECELTESPSCKQPELVHTRYTLREEK